MGNARLMIIIMITVKTRIIGGIISGGFSNMIIWQQRFNLTISNSGISKPVMFLFGDD